MSMSISDWTSGEFPTIDPPPASPEKEASPAGVRLHRIATVRRRQGVSLRRASRLLGADVHTLKGEETETSDLPLSRVYQWQKVLEVPIGDLLTDAHDTLSAPILERARLVRLMKTVAAILEKPLDTSVRRLAEMLSAQLTEIMPELKCVSPWHTVGQRRTLEEYGRIVERVFPERLWRDD